MNSVKDFYNNFDNRLLKDFISNNPRVVAALEFVRDYFGPNPPQAILDIGCGIGWSSYEFSRLYKNGRVKGIDLSDRLITVAKQIFTAPNLSFSEKDLTDSSMIANEQYDAVVMIDVFEHIPADSRSNFYQDLKKVLSKEFSILLTCPTKKHQEFLRSNNPQGLQPVDEDIDARVLQDFASSLGAELVFYTHRSIWRTNDYLHAVISNKITYQDIPAADKKMSLMNQSEKKALLVRKRIPLEGVTEFFGQSFIKRIKKSLR
ncbi:class I SAM-dependent methyltransferase [Flavihumibacter sp. RY-1]|uniref:Class I SAM-dependent methyltransferase n=1 Tax=Flavihumibacter fluminis TaxID=2909236 RepID=A0ABS9BKZ0_9BACT|nr:class I SAM-dependent methyltransferase [Flavihumibacter fluminis]MCF1716369.1 class I SAM-dependent methyltransferase [Flavihumibacter fluminis]